MPEKTSSDVTRASSSAPLIRRSIPSLEKSLEYVLAVRWPMNARSPIARDPDSFSVSTSPIRTTVENSEPSRTTASAAVAPDFIARETTLVARPRRSVSTSLTVCVWVAIILPGFSSRGTAHGHTVELQRGNANADRHRLSIFAAGAHAFIQLKIVAYHGNFRQSVRAIPNQRAVLERRGYVSVLNHVGL